MSTKPNTTIDDIGAAWYHRYEADKSSYDYTFSSDSRHIAEQLRTDALMPLSVTNEFIDFGKTGAPWPTLLAPLGYNEQRRRLFVHQLAPRLGPEDLLDTLFSRIDEKMKEELASRKGRGAPQKELHEVEHQGNSLLDMVKIIGVYNTMITAVDSAKDQYKKG